MLVAARRLPAMASDAQYEALFEPELDLEEEAQGVEERARGVEETPSETP